MKKLNLEDLDLVNGGTNYDDMSEEDIAYFKTRLAHYKQIGLKKETMIDLHIRLGEDCGWPPEYTEKVIDMINLYWYAV